MAPTESFRIVQLTPPGSSASIAVGVNLTPTAAEPGSTHGLRLVVDDIDAAVTELGSCGCIVTQIEDRPWGCFAWFNDPDGNGWELNQPAQQS